MELHVIEREGMVINQDNQSDALVRNKCLELAEGEFILLIDSSDFLEYNVLGQMYSKAISTDSDIVICKTCEYDEVKKEYISNLDNASKHNTEWKKDKLIRKSFLGIKHITFSNIQGDVNTTFVNECLKKAEDINYIDSELIYYCSNRDNCKETEESETRPKEVRRINRNNVKLSIIITTHNKVNGIKDIFKDIRKQSLKDIEIIIIDYSSINKSTEWISGFAQKRDICTAYHIDTNNVNEARLYGLEQAKGQYISFLDINVSLKNSLFYEDMIRVMELRNLPVLGAQPLLKNGEYYYAVSVAEKIDYYLTMRSECDFGKIGLFAHIFKKDIIDADILNHTDEGMKETFVNYGVVKLDGIDYYEE